MIKTVQSVSFSSNRNCNHLQLLKYIWQDDSYRDPSALSFKCKCGLPEADRVSAKHPWTSHPRAQKRAKSVADMTLATFTCTQYCKQKWSKSTSMVKPEQYLKHCRLLQLAQSLMHQDNDPKPSKATPEWLKRKTKKKEVLQWPWRSELIVLFSSADEVIIWKLRFYLLSLPLPKIRVLDNV